MSQQIDIKRLHHACNNGGPPSGMAGKDGKVEPKSGDVVRQGFMVKRSQNKKRFTPVNYKQRWFVLTRRYLVYYDGDGEGAGQCDGPKITYTLEG
ncbi:hypothetical protein E2986_13821 [Frieseomelitta varia]|uniref:PH domain-containing protein n=1 Tax=Frieseomelitta varia TaxID=561572 RepID=A0A833VRU8_9HYME|nr:hypothetical protein E2986_13821 [Frieseomelitta varia]